MPIAAVAAIATAGASIYSANKQASAAKKAASASQQASDQSVALQRDIYNQQRADQMPWLQQGAQAANLLGSFYGFTPSAVPAVQAAPTTTTPTPTPNQGQQGPFGNVMMDQLYARLHGNPLAEATQGQAAQPAVQSATQVPASTIPATTPTPATTTNPMDKFFASPDYQFRLNEGNRNILGGAAATGGLQSGDTLKALQSYGQNMASGEFGNYWNRLAGLAGVGQTSASNVGQAGQAYAGNTSNILMQNAANRGSSYMNNANAWAQGVGGLAGAIGWGVNQFPRG